MRQAKGYEDLFTLRVPFLIDSAVYETASALRRGDEIVAINDAQGLEYPAYREYLKAHAGEDVTLTVKREGDMLLQIAVPVSDEGKLGVMDYYQMKNVEAFTGGGHGLHVLVSASDWIKLGNTIQNQINTRYELKLASSNNSQVRARIEDKMIRPQDRIPADQPGRGINSAGDVIRFALGIDEPATWST